VAARQAQAGSPAGGGVLLSAADFHRWLSLARLVALSFGRTELGADAWRYMRALERRREARAAEVAPLAPPTPPPAAARGWPPTAGRGSVAASPTGVDQAP
jgi:hypothetical protein